MKTQIWPREVKLFEAYLDWRDSDEAAELREAGGSTDFLTYNSALITKRLMSTYRETPSAWNRYSATYSVPDFKPITFVGLLESEDLKKIGEHDSYRDTPLRERTGVTLSVDTYGDLFSITRRALINDDIGLLRDAPGRMGRAAARTLSRSVLATLESNANAYDGTATFHSSHGNLSTEALSETSIQNGSLLLSQQTDDNGNPITLIPELLVIPPGLEMTARRIFNSTEIHIRGTNDTISSTPAYGMGNYNTARDLVTGYVVERYATDPNNYWLFASVDEAPVIAVGFLNGQRNPQVMLRDPGMRLILGGSDPYDMEIDQMWWKIRHEWGSALVDWRGAVFFNVP